MTKKFLLVDGKNLLFRAGFASRNLKTRDGRMSGAIHGFIKMLCRVRTQHPDVELIVLWEQAGKLTYRHKLLPGYKQRPKAEPDSPAAGIHDQIKGVQALAKAVGLHWVELDCIEADDLAGLLSVALSKLGHEVLLLSGDKDWWQLASIPNVIVISEQGVGRDEPVLTDERVRETFNCKAKELVRFRPFVGDTGDKIPPCKPRFMQKHALQLVAAGVDPRKPLSEQPAAVQAFPGIAEVWPNYQRNYKLMKIARSAKDCCLDNAVIEKLVTQVTGPLPPKNYREMLGVLADWELDDAMSRRSFIFGLAQPLSMV